ncbi:MAG: hydrogen peroxide-inducible genes activator [Pseudomonadota bacterium]
MPTLRQLEYLIAIADLGHFGRAADRVHVSQPTLSQQIRTLEQRLGVKLVERESRGAELTPIGREIATKARKILVDVRDLRDTATKANDGRAGTLRFGVSPTIGPYFMPDIVRQLHQLAPNLRLYIREGIPIEQVQELASGSIDILLGPLPIENSALEIEPLFHEPLYIVAPPDHRLAQKDDLQKSDFSGTGFLSLDPKHHYHIQTKTIADELGADILRDYEGTSLDSLRQMVGSGLGISLLPEFYLSSEVGGVDMVKRLEVKDWKASRSIGMAWRRGAAYEDTYRWMGEYIREKALERLAQAQNSQ